MNRQFEDFKKEYIGTVAPAKRWDEIAGKLGPQSHLSKTAIVKSTLAISAILILSAAFLYMLPESPPPNNQSAVKNDGQEIAAPQEATPTVTPLENLNLEKPQQAPEPEKQELQEEQEEEKKGRFWDFIQRFYRRQDKDNDGEVKGDHWDIGPRYRFDDR